MITRSEIAAFLFGQLGNVITHHLFTFVGVLATGLTRLIRKTERWLRARPAARRKIAQLSGTGSSGSTGRATLTDSPTLIPSTGPIMIVGQRPLVSSSMPPAVAMAESMEPSPFTLFPARTPWMPFWNHAANQEHMERAMVAVNSGMHRNVALLGPGGSVYPERHA